MQLQPGEVNDLHCKRFRGIGSADAPVHGCIGTGANLLDNRVRILLRPECVVCPVEELAIDLLLVPASCCCPLVWSARGGCLGARRGGRRLRRAGCGSGRGQGVGAVLRVLLQAPSLKRFQTELVTKVFPVVQDLGNISGTPTSAPLGRLLSVLLELQALEPLGEAQNRLLPGGGCLLLPFSELVAGALRVQRGPADDACCLLGRAGDRAQAPEHAAADVARGVVIGSGAVGDEEGCPGIDGIVNRGLCALNGVSKVLNGVLVEGDRGQLLLQRAPQALHQRGRHCARPGLASACWARAAGGGGRAGGRGGG
mmetsp:Transcript_70762/g.207285  ORF Transcript_70762/g.207285 Transcript_70762/m.207285 type:complete len:312 (+) Transcript_70762:1115-2050(+)